MAEQRVRRVFRFGPYELDPLAHELRRDGQRVHIQTKPFTLLLYLLEHADQVVGHEELLKAVWPGVRVEPGAVKSAIHSLRRSLGTPDLPPAGDDASASASPSPSEEGWIVSAHGRGYRLRGAQVATLEEPAAPHALARSVPSDFVDRETEMGQLRALCRAARAGQRQIVLLGGPPGIGKTRTATELAAAAEALGFEIYLGRTHEGEGAPPFWPWAQLIQGWTQRHGAARLQELAGAGSRAEDLLGLAPELEPGTDTPAASTYTRADQARFRMFDRVSRFLERAARERALLLVLDDLHRADSASIELLVFVAQHVLHAPLAIVVTHRPLGSAHPIGRVLHEPGTCSIPLAGLVRSSVEQILERSCGRRANAGLVDRVHAASGGNPLFVYELARALGASDAPEAALPARVHDAVWARICECSPACLDLLRVASAGGPGLTLAVLRGALDGEALLETLEEAERRDLLFCTDGVYGFVHGVVREALYEKLAPTERVQIHLRIGEALEALQASQPATRLTELAHHFLEGAALNGAERAVRYARRAAQGARAVCAFPEEVELRRRALRALDFVEPPDPELRGRMLVELGDALGHGAAPIAEFQDAFLRALELAHQHGSLHLLACAAERCIWHMSSRGAFLPVLTPSPDQPLVRALIADLATVQEAHEIQADPVLHGRIYLALTLALAEDHPEESRRALERAVAIAVRSADAELRGEVLVQRYSYAFDDLAARDGFQRELLAWTLETQNQTFEVEARQLGARNALERGDRAAYDRIAAELEPLAARGLLSALYYCDTWRFVCAQMDGPVVAATERAQRLARTGGRLNLDPGWLVWTLGLQMGWLMLHAGMTDMLLLQAAEYAPRVWQFREIRMSVAWLYAAAGRRDEARALLGELPRHGVGFGRGEIWLCAMTAAAEACLWIGDRERAGPIFAALAPYAGRVASFVMLILGPVSRHLGALAALLERWDEAEALFDAAARQAQTLRSRVFSTLVDAERALAFRAHPDPDQRRRSEELRARAESAARELGLHLVAARLGES